MPSLVLAAATWLLLAGVAACSPVSATSACTAKADCPAGYDCIQGKCVPQNAYACTAASECQDALKNGNWKPGEVGACQAADCVAKTCKLVNKAAGDSCDDGDALDCQHGACTADGKCEAAKVIDSDKCLIGGACKKSGDPNDSDAADGACQVCDPKASQTDWSAASDGAPCADDKVSCTVDACKGKTCNHDAIAKDECRIGGACQASGEASAGNPCQVCNPATSQSQWSDAPKDTTCTADDKDCTDDLCSGKTCQAVPNDKGCLIASACVAPGTAKPDNPCLVCDPAASKTDWSPAKAGTACQDDLDCTVDSCDGKGGCDSSALKADACLVQDGGKPRCMAAGEPKTAELTCQVCDPGKDPKQFTELGDGAACSPGKPCLLGQCKAGTCENKGANPNSCLIAADDACVAAKDLNPKNPCQACEPSLSQTAWSDLPAAATCPTDGVDCTSDHCDGSGTCLHELQNSACTGKDGPCTTGVCDAAQGCVAVPKDVTVVCEGDGVACTVEVCDGKSNCSTTGKPTDTLCDDQVKCTLDTCDPQKGCQHTAQDTACPDGNACTADLCDAKAGCSNPPMSDGAPCKLDDLACTADACSKGACVAPITGGNCLIDNTCHSDGETTQGGCSWCNSALTQEKWTLLADNAPCATDNQVCTDDKCAAGKCQHTANTQPCATDNVACTLDICAGGGCQHQPQVSQCDDGLPCTDNQCDLTKGCLYVDNCAYGHACDATAKACLTEKGQAFELVKTSLADPNPTNAALGRHDLDATGTTQRTWLAWQSQSCATVVGGAWNITQGSQLRAMALDPQVKAAGSKDPPTTVNLPQASLWNGSATVCQAFPTIAPDPKSKTRWWLSWLESDPAQPTAPKQCLLGAGEGGVWRIARLDGASAQGSVTAAGEICGMQDGFGPLFLTSGVAPLDGTGQASSDPAVRSFLSLRTEGSSLKAWTKSIFLNVGTGSSMPNASSFGPGVAIPNVAPVLVDFGTTVADASKRYLALAVTEDGTKRGLWGYFAASDGSKAAADGWATSDATVTAVFNGATAVCSLDAAVDDAGTLAVVLVTRKNTQGRVDLVTRTAAGVTSSINVETVSFSSDCRFGLTAARVAPTASGWLVTDLNYSTTAGTDSNLNAWRVEGGKLNAASFLVDNHASTTDAAEGSAPSTALAWRGLTTPTRSLDGAWSAAFEYRLNDTSSRSVKIRTWKP
ncbi:MAG: hypothetical protein HY902_00590 [Deltaproteobacteria bacterium]|nr:hypothetical protein [Deltaproteobacteria bacterium]